MERVYLYRTNRKFVRFFLIFSIIVLIISLFLLSRVAFFWLINQSVEFHWNYLTYALQSVAFILLAMSFLKKEKNFIEWNEKEINYLLPKSTEPVNVIIANIKGVEIGLNAVIITENNLQKIITLENAEYKDLKRIKNRFEEIKRALL